MSDNDSLLRELLEHKIDALREHIDLRFDASDTALRLQAEKNERHFDTLNHEQARLLADRERYLQKEVHEPWKRGIEEWRDGVNKALTRTMTMAAAWSTIVASVAAWAAVYFGK